MTTSLVTSISVHSWMQLLNENFERDAFYTEVLWKVLSTNNPNIMNIFSAVFLTPFLVGFKWVLVNKISSGIAFPLLNSIKSVYQCTHPSMYPYTHGNKCKNNFFGAQGTPKQIFLSKTKNQIYLDYTLLSFAFKIIMGRN